MDENLLPDGWADLDDDDLTALNQRLSARREEIRVAQMEIAGEFDARAAAEAARRAALAESQRPAAQTVENGDIETEESVGL